MKKIMFFLAVFLFAAVFFGSSCDKKTDTSPAAGGSWIFWTDEPVLSPDGIFIWITDANYPTQGFVTKIYSSIPACNSDGCFTASLATMGTTVNNHVRTFHYIATDSLSPTQVHKWTGIMPVNDSNWQHCNTSKLHY